MIFPAKNYISVTYPALSHLYIVQQKKSFKTWFTVFPFLRTEQH